MKKKSYKKPVMTGNNINTGLPTVLAIGVASAAIGAASVAVGKMVGDIQNMKVKLNSGQQIIGGLNA